MVGNNQTILAQNMESKQYHAFSREGVSAIKIIKNEYSRGKQEKIFQFVSERVI